ncbi:SBBP repeat-containing protein [Paludibaculum fermentans]|uniref:RCC1 domain-containing protein n=1 Tax=Paludibaculum fermentans TaxID=1473598 RepID=UPI003EBEF357
MEAAPQKVGASPISFEQNVGQMSGQARFAVRGASEALFLAAGEAVYVRGPRLTTGPPARKAMVPGGRPDLTEILAAGVPTKPGATAAAADVSDPAVVRMQFAGAQAAVIAGHESRPATGNWFYGNDRSRWRANIPSFGRVRYEGLYPGIDLEFRGDDDRLEYDFVLGPNADPDRIRLRFQGARSQRINAEGDLVLETHQGPLVHRKPVLYQTTATGRRRVDGQFALLASGEVAFRVGDYDRSRALVIDPVVYNTRLGGATAGVNDGKSAPLHVTWYTPRYTAADSSGKVYVIGYTTAWDFPVVNGPRVTPTGGLYLAKFDPALSGSASLLYSAVLGPVLPDFFTGRHQPFLAVDDTGNAYVTFAAKSGFPIVGGFDTSAGGMEAALVRVDTTKSGLQSLAYSTYIGGSRDDTVWGMDLDTTGNVYVAGHTSSWDLSITQNAYDMTCGTNGTCDVALTPTNTDAFFMKINTRLSGQSSLVYGSFFGGSLFEIQPTIKVSRSGLVYLVGHTQSADLPTRNAYDTNCGVSNCNGGKSGDIFIAKFDLSVAGSNGLLYSTYFGGDGTIDGHDPFSSGRSWTGAEYAIDIEVDETGNLFLYGISFPDSLGNFPLKLPFNAKSHWSDFFFTRIDTTLSGESSLVFSTYVMGQTLTAFGFGEMARDAEGMLYLTGLSDDAAAPTANGAQGAPRGAGDAFLVKLDPYATGAAALKYSSYLGGSGSELTFGVEALGAGVAVVAGTTDSADFPMVKASQSFGGSTDLFLARFDTTKSGAASLLEATTIGGESDEGVQLWGGSFSVSLATDAAGNAYIHSWTDSSAYPATSNAWQTGQNPDAAGQDQFQEYLVTAVLAKLAPPNSSCEYKVSPGSRLIPYVGGGITFSVETSAGCPWTASTNASFLSFPSTNVFNGPGTVEVQVAPYARTDYPRLGFLTIAGKVVSLEQSNAPCTPALLITNYMEFPVGGGAALVQWSGDCPASPSRSESWIDKDYSATTANSQNFTVASNGYGPAGFVRQGRIKLNEQDLVIRQAGPSCPKYLANGLVLKVGAAGVVNFPTPGSTSAACPITFSSSAPWIGLTAGITVAGGGNRTLLTVQPNPSATTRTGQITVFDQVYDVEQSGTGCTYTVTPSPLVLSATDTVGTLTVNTTVGCHWTATSLAPWLRTSVYGAAGSGPGTFQVYPSYNQTRNLRTGSVSVAGTAVTVSQAGLSCDYTVSPAEVTIPYRMSASNYAQAVPITVTTAAGCLWAGESSAEWAPFGDAATSYSTTGVKGGSGSVSLWIDLNPGPPRRSATVTVAGKTVTVTQEADPKCTAVQLQQPAITIGSEVTAWESSANVTGVCTLLISTASPWLSVANRFVSANSGYGPAAVGLTAARNPGAARTATVQVSDQVLTVTQEAAGATPSVTFTSSVAGLPFMIDGVRVVAPAVFNWSPGTSHIADPPVFFQADASARSRYTFATWKEGSPRVMNLTAPSASRTFTAVYSAEHLLKVSYNPPEACNHAAPADMWRAAGSEAYGGCDDVVAPYMLQSAVVDSVPGGSTLMNGPHTIQYNYVKGVTVTVNTAPAGLQIYLSDDEESIWSTPFVHRMLPGATLPIGIAGMQPGQKGMRYRFLSWSDGGAISHVLTVPATPGSSFQVTAQMEAQAQLVLTSYPSTGGTLKAEPASADGYYVAGTSVSVTATATAGQKLMGFSGGLQGLANPQTVIVTVPTYVGATFGSGCWTTVSPTAVDAGPLGGGQMLQVEAPAGCPWAVQAGATWFGIAGVTSGIGPMTLTATVAANSGGSRQGVLKIGSVDVPVRQQAAYQISSLAGGGPAQLPKLMTASGDTPVVAPDGSVFFSESTPYKGARVLRVSASGKVSVYGGNGTAADSGDGGPALLAGIRSIKSMAMDRAGNLYLSDWSSYKIRRIAAGTGIITTVAGAGIQSSLSADGIPAISAAIDPRALAVDAQGVVHFVDGANRVRKIEPAGGTLVTVAGSAQSGFGGDQGPAAAALFSYIYGLAFAPNGDLYLSDSGNHRVRRIRAVDGTVQTVAGSGIVGAFSGENGPAITAILKLPFCVILDANGNLFFTDRDANRILRVDAVSGTLTRVAGTGATGVTTNGGQATQTPFSSPYRIALLGNSLIVDGYPQTHSVDLGTGLVSGFAGQTTASFTATSEATRADLAVGPMAYDAAAGALYLLSGYQVLRLNLGTGVLEPYAGTGVSNYSKVEGPALSLPLYQPVSLAVDGSGNLYIADGNQVRKVDGATRLISSFAGASGLYCGGASPQLLTAGDGGPAASAGFCAVSSLAYDGAGSLYISDLYRIRKVDLNTGIITAFAGAGYVSGAWNVLRTDIYFQGIPRPIAADSTGGVYFLDRTWKSSCQAGVYRIDPASSKSSCFVSALKSVPAAPTTFALGTDGSIALFGSNAVLRASGPQADVAGIAGQENSPGLGAQSGSASAARFGGTATLSPGPGGSFFVADTDNGRIRQLSPVTDGMKVHQVETAPAGLWITVDGATYAGSQSFIWQDGSTHTLTVAAAQDGSSTAYAFNNWSDGGGSSHSITAPSAATTYTASYKTRYRVEGSATPVAAGTVTLTPASLDGYYDSGSNVRFQANPANAQSTFLSWGGSLSGTANPLLATVVAPLGGVASFTSSTTGYTISGNAGVAGASITLTGSKSATTLADAAGRFAFQNLPAGGSYTVTPSVAKYTFTPSISSRTNLQSNQIVNFTAFSSGSPVQASVMARLNWSLKLNVDGTLWSWGANLEGELGDGTLRSRSLPAQVSGLTSVVTAATGSNHGLAARSDGTVWAWGLNSSGQLGDGSVQLRPSPVQVTGITGVIGLSGGARHSLAVKSDGTVWAWGSNTYGQLGDGGTTTRTTAVKVLGLSGVVAVAAGDYFSLALKSDGTVWSWGYNNNGQLGDGTTTTHLAPVQVPGLSEILALRGGSSSAYALRSDGSVWAWGDNNYAQLGDASGTQRSSPAKVSGVSNVVGIGAGSYFCLAVKSDGTVWAWGMNDYGQLGIAPTSNSPVPLQVAGVSSAVAVAAGLAHGLALRSDGSVMAWGYGGYGELGNGAAILQAVPFVSPLISNVARVALGSSHAAAARTDGTVWTWGGNEYGQLGDGTVLPHAAPAAVSGSSGFSHVASGNAHVLALKSDGTVWAWGYGGMGALGNGATANGTAPIQVHGITGAIAIAAGNHFSLALKSDGTVWAWGSNGVGQLGDGSTTDRNTPIQVSGLSGIVSIAAGLYHGLAAKSDGTVWAWGSNDSAQLGDGSTTGRKLPVQVMGLTGISRVGSSYAANSSYAVKSDGTVWAWGDNALGQLGHGAPGAGVSTPVQVSGLAGISAVAAGSSHVLALKSDGAVWAWGYNAHGQLGDGTTADRTTPAQIGGLSGIVSVAAGSDQSMAVKADGTLWGWGATGYGQLGTGVSMLRPTPGPLAAPLPMDLAIAVSAGGMFSVGSQVTFSLAVTNVGGLPSTGAVTVTDQLPVGLTYVSATGAGWVCGAVGQTVTCTSSNPIFASMTSTIVVTVNVTGATNPSASNTASVAVTGDANAANNSATVVLTAPITAAVGVTPSAGTGAQQMFKATFTGAKGYQSLKWVQVLFATAPNGGGQPFCFLHYDVTGNGFWLYSDVLGFFVGPIAPGVTSAVLQGAHCALNTAGSSASGNGATLELNLAVVFKAAANRSIYLRAFDADNFDTNAVQRGTWTQAAAPLVVPVVTPGSGTGSNPTFNLRFPDPQGFEGAALGWEEFLVAAATDGGGQPFCFVHYDRAGNGLWMYSSDVGFFAGPVTPGVASSVLSSSACSVNTAGTTVQNSAGNLELNVPVTLKPPMSGAKFTYMRTQDALNRDTGWLQKGTWTIP